MAGKTRTLLLSLTITAVIVFSAFGPTIAYADGDSPESPPAEATTTPEEATAEQVSTETTSNTEEVTPEATPAPEEGAAPEEEIAPAESGGDESEPSPEATASEPTKEDAPVAEEEAAAAPKEPVLTEVPENTTITVLDENGESQPLATQEAAEAIAASDPIWCPEGASPTPGANGCTDSFGSFDELLTFLSGNTTYQGNGTIYVEQGNYQGNDPGGVIDFNAPTYDLSNIRNSSLTVTGGWDPGSGTTDPASTSNFNNTRILIGSSTSPWGGSVTINNITMTFSQVDVAPATPENGLTIYSAQDVALSNVDVSVATSAGAEIDAGGNVTITDSNFHRNKTAGAIIRAGGNVNISDSEFQNPLVTRQRRQIVGLDIDSGGEVSLLNVLANGNREVGADINAGSAVTIGSSAFSGTKEMVGPADATQFLGFGLRVVTPAEINIDNVTANDNFLWGANLDGGGPIAIRNSVFNANTTEAPRFIDDTGLFIRGGSIVSLFNVQADGNRLFGAQIDAVGNVSIGGDNLGPIPSSFSNNRGVINTDTGDTYHGHGLQITTLADIIINNTTATGNMLFGGELTAGGQVNIANSTFSNTSTGVAANAVGQGLRIVSGSDTSLGNVILDNNQTDGANIQAGGSVSLTNVTATNNGDDGVEVDASCVHLMGGTYTGNGGYGLNLAGNTALNQIAAPTFGSNGAGDIFPDTPPTCSFVTTPLGPTAAATNLFASLQLAPQSSESTAAESASTANVSLNEFMRHTRTFVGNIEVGIFHGNYVYAYSSAGMQILALAPSFDTLAME